MSHDDSTAIRALAKLRACQGWLSFHLGQLETAHALLTQSLALLDQDGASEDRVFTLVYLAKVTHLSGNYVEGEHLGKAALATSEQLGDQHGTVNAKTILGQVTYRTGAYAEAQRWSLESLALEQTLGNRWGTVFTLLNLGRVAMALEAYEDARRWFEEGLAIPEMMGYPRGVGLFLTSLGDVASALGEHAEAERRYQASLSRKEWYVQSCPFLAVSRKLKKPLHQRPRMVALQDQIEIDSSGVAVLVALQP